MEGVLRRQAKDQVWLIVALFLASWHLQRLSPPAFPGAFPAHKQALGAFPGSSSLLAQAQWLRACDFQRLSRADLRCYMFSRVFPAQFPLLSPSGKLA